jgi:hypothetical protein
MTEKRVALLIASYQYQDADLQQLVAPPQDAAALAMVLQNPAIGDFAVQTLLNEPTYKVNQIIEFFFSDRQRDDLLLFYFSGHGIKDEDGQLYFAMTDTRRKLLRSTAISANFVNEVMRRSRSRRQVLLLDCCYSGAFARGMVAKSDKGISTGDHFEGRGRVVLTASDAMQYSFEGDEVKGEGVRSIFTRTLVHGLETGQADLNKNGYISLDELYDFVHDQVTDETPQQRPGKWAFGVQGEITIAQNPHPVITSAELPLELRQAEAQHSIDEKPTTEQLAIEEAEVKIKFKFVDWLLRLLMWAKIYWKISLPLVILISLLFCILSNANTWAFTSVEIWSEDELNISGEEIAMQFRGNLNAIGTTPLDVLMVSVPSPPAAVTNAKSALQPLSLDDCSQIMIGPKSFVSPGGREPLSLPRLSRTQADVGTAGQISLGTAVSDLNVPVSGLTRFLIRYTAPNYRELYAEIVPASRFSEAGYIRVIVTALDGSRWTAEGSWQTLPQLINFLAYRIALDWKAERTGQTSDLIKSDDLALTLGNQAFTARDFTAALAYYRLAEWFRADSAIIEIMLGLTQFRLSTTAISEEEAKTLRDKASRSFNQAFTLEPNNPDLYPYLACLHHWLGDGQLAEQRINDFNATLGPDSPDAKQERIIELDKKPPLGPGRHISVFAHESGFDLYYISDDATHFALNLPYDVPLDDSYLSFELLIAGEAPRQIFAMTSGAYYLTSDGLANFFRPGNPPQIIPIIDTDNLQFMRTPTGELILGMKPIEDSDLIYNTGGIRQIFAKDELLFLVDRFGRILRLRVVQTGTGGLDVTLEAVAEIDARQIFLDNTNTLYLLKEDGTVWRISDPLIGDLQTARQLVTDTDNREITASNGVIYMLRTNGNIWRYLDGEGIGGDLLKRIDEGVETSRIFIAPQGLLVLKNSGVMWLIRNPQNPGENDIEQLTIPTANRVAINVTGSNLIALERDETAGPVIEIYQNLLQMPTSDQIEQISVASPTPIPTSTPTVAANTPTPSPTPTAINTPSPTEISTPEAEIDITTVISQTRAVDNALEVLFKNTEDETNWFWIDRTEVTNRQYQTCVDAEACTENAGGYADLFYEAEHPVVGVDWQQAQNYCQWVEGSLPTVSQWRAAASPDGRIYPWGDTGPSCQVAVINDACDTEEAGTRPVGSKPEGATPFGVLDMVGNVWEWTATLGTALGGSWSNPDGTLLGGFEAFNPANALSQDEAIQANNLGFRCVRAYTPASTE